MENKMGKRTRTLYPLLVAGTMVMGGLLGATSASAATDCVVGPGVTQNATTVTGTSANDTIDCTGADPGKTINGNDGDDTITGTAFADTIKGGAGNDTITGGPGNDTITGGTGNDSLTGSAGIDKLSGDAGNDTLQGPATDGSRDKLNGGADTDGCFGVPEDAVSNCES